MTESLSSPFLIHGLALPPCFPGEAVSGLRYPYLPAPVWRLPVWPPASLSQTLPTRPHSFFRQASSKVTLILPPIF